MLKMFATNDFKIIKLRDNSISCGKETHPLIGVSARVENGSDIEKRVTFTRLLLLGIFAFAMQKKKGGEKYLCIEGPDFAWMTEVKNKNTRIAMRFATEVNNAVRKAQFPVHEAVQSPVLHSVKVEHAEVTREQVDSLAELTEQFQEGKITFAQFNEAKQKLIN